MPGPHSRKSEKRRGGAKRAGRRENPKTRRLREEAVQRSDADKAFIATLASGGDTVVSLNGAECGVPVKVSGALRKLSWQSSACLQSAASEFLAQTRSANCRWPFPDPNAATFSLSLRLLAVTDQVALGSGL